MEAGLLEPRAKLEVAGMEQGSDADVFLVRSDDQGHSWSSFIDVNGAANSTQDARVPRMAVSPSGELIVTWHSQDNPGNTIGGDIDIFFAVSR